MSTCMCMAKDWGGRCLCADRSVPFKGAVIVDDPRMSDHENKAIWVALSLLQKDHAHFKVELAKQQNVQTMIVLSVDKVNENLRQHQLNHTKHNDDILKVVTDADGQLENDYIKLSKRMEKLQSYMDTEDRVTCSDVLLKLNALEKFNENLTHRLLKDRESNHKWQRDVEEKCCRVMDKNKELQVEVDALKQLVWKLREEILIVNKHMVLSEKKI